MMRRGWAEAMRMNEEGAIPILMRPMKEPKLWELWTGGEPQSHEGSEQVKQVIDPDPGYRDNDGRWANLMVTLFTAYRSPEIC